jgi:GntR family histidine utilization transcriptional repressor
MAPSRENMSYKDIKRVVLERIQKRIWAPDSLLPSEVELAEEFSSTRTTVNRALRELAEEGFLERKRKAGTRVLNAPLRKAQFAIPQVSDEIKELGKDYRYSLVKRETLKIPDWLSAKLATGSDQSVLYIEAMHFADNAPFQYEVRWIVTKSVPAALEVDFAQVGPGAWLAQEMPFTDLEVSFSATQADQQIAAFLDAREGDPIFTTQRTTWLRAQPVTHARLYFPPGYKMTTRL